MSVPVQTAQKSKVTTTSPVVAKAVTVANGNKTVVVAAPSAPKTKVAATPTTTLAAPKAKTVVAVAAAVGTISNYGPNSHNGTQATGTANRAFDVTS